MTKVMSQRLKDKICVITGGARGIGATTARLFAEEGAALVLADIRDEPGEQVTSGIRSLGGKAVYVHTDVTKSADAKNLADAAVNAFGTIDVLFNNAGIAIQGKVDVLAEEDWDKTFNVNVKGMFLCAKFVIPVMRSRGGGVIINQSSESGLIGFPMHPAYCASKAAVINLTRSMATGHAHEKIRVNCICPGTIPTPLYEEFLSTLPDRDQVEAMVKSSHPLGLGTEEDIAYAALFLASDESRYMTGAPLIVDGGLTAL
jgi:NAD(P)-dependent dehydrogenase (short-subunit alcohol dehydrogenase family)